MTRFMGVTLQVLGSLLILAVFQAGIVDRMDSVTVVIFALYGGAVIVAGNVLYRGRWR